MKRMIPYLLGLLALLAAGGCGQGASDAPGFTDADLYLTIGGAPYRCHTNMESVVETLGEDYEYAEGRSCDYDGLDKTFLYDVAEFYTWPLQEGDIVNEIYTDSPEAATSRGIAVGAAKDEVLAAYGEDCEDTGWQLIYRSPDGVALCFDLENGVVKAISLTAQPV